jgi:predicted phage tail protein
MLTNGTTYTFRVAAINAVGTGPMSAESNPVTPFAPAAPEAPTIGTATAGNGQATVSWTAPTSDGGSPITAYEVTPYIGFAAQTPTTFNSTATTQTITMLTNGTTYRFRVRAINAVGFSGYSKVTNPVTPTA